ncbi:hypothetical protein JCM14124_26600 [Humidesulfovibrio idahonensis]
MGRVRFSAAGSRAEWVSFTWAMVRVNGCGARPAQAARARARQRAAKGRNRDKRIGVLLGMRKCGAAGRERRQRRRVGAPSLR